MSELNIKIRKLQDNGSTFRATPESLYMGGVGSAKVDTLCFDVPEEWKGCAITLHVQRLSGTLPDPQLLDEKNRAVVDQRWTKEKQGLWMLMAVGADGYTAMTKPGRYTCYETIDRDSTTETITPSVYEQFVALVKKETAEANRAAKNAAASAEIAKNFESTITATGEQIQREITATADQTKQAVDEKAKAALASIPEDYTTLSESVGQLKEDLADLKNNIDSPIQLGVFEKGSYNKEIGQFVDIDYAIRSHYIKLNPDRYNFVVNSGYLCSVYIFDENKNFVKSYQDFSSARTFTIAETSYALIVLWRTDESNIITIEDKSNLTVDCQKKTNDLVLGELYNKAFGDNGEILEFTNVIITDKISVAKKSIIEVTNNNNYTICVAFYNDDNTLFRIENNIVDCFYTYGKKFIIKIYKEIQGQLVDLNANTYDAKEVLFDIKSIEIEKSESIITVASSTASDYEKSISDFVCTGTNDEIVLNQAIQKVSEKGGEIHLSYGDFFIDDFTSDVGGNVACLFPMTYSDISVIGKGIGFSPKTQAGTRIIVTENLLNKLGSNDTCTIFRSAYSEKYHFSSLKFKYLSIELADNTRKITVFDMFYSWRCEFKSVAIYGFRVNGIVGMPNQLAVEGCVGIKMLDGSNYGFENRFDDVACIGFYEGFKVGGEHIIMNNCSAIYNVYGYTFGNYEWFSAFVHAITMINCCDERNVNLPKFFKSGYYDDNGYHGGGRQCVDMINLIIERYAEMTVGGVLGNLMDMEDNEQFCGNITFTMLQHNKGIRNSIDTSLFENGKGVNFKVKNNAHKLFGNTSLRNSYGANNMQEYFDTDLGKMLWYFNNSWHDANGTVVS